MSNNKASKNKATKITQQDLKTYPAERLTDNSDGGGMPVGKPLTGKPNELFNPISSIARVNGAFYARLTYMGVMRADDEPLIGAFCAITEPPNDPSVSYLLFRASKYGELRHEILQRIEAYSVGTIESRMTLLSTQSKYSKIIQAYQRPGEPLPLVGDVYCLRQDKQGYPFHEQYVQVIAVSSEDRTFVNPRSGKEFVRTVVKLEISSKLTADFIGVDYPREDYADNPCKIRETHIADAAQYYGVKPLATAINKETTRIAIPSLMEKLVPTNQVETALIDLTAAGQRQTLFDAAVTGDDGSIKLSVNHSHRSSGITKLYTGNPIIPDSLQIQTNSGIISDHGGTLFYNDTVVGSVDYSQSTVIINTDTSLYLQTLNFRPAASKLRVADTAKIDVAINNRSYNYVLTINPSPAVGSLIVSYRAQGRWYDLREDGTGALRGISQAHGSGSINFVTGTISISCGELPDVGSAILFSWGSKASYFQRAGGTTNANMVLTLAKDADPASIRLSWHDGQEKSAQCDATGNISGDWSGTYDPATRQIRIDTGKNFHHSEGALTITTTYSHGEKTHQEHKAPLRDEEGYVPIDLGDTPISPGSVRLRWNLLIEDYDVITYGKVQTRHVDPYKTVRDDSNGKLIDEKGKTVGTIDYAGRRLRFQPDTTVMIPKSTYSKTAIGEEILSTEGGKQSYRTRYRNVFTGYEYVPAGASMPIDESALVEVWFYEKKPESSITEQLSSGTLLIDLLPHRAEVVVPGSVHFNYGNQQYFDRQGGIYTDLNPATGAATQVGSIDYQAGLVTLNQWTWKNLPSIVQSLATIINANPVDAVTFRTPSSPIRPGSLQVRATATDGSLLTATADYGGNIKGNDISGSIDAEYGVVDVRFGAWVTAAGNEKADWYNADAVTDNGKIFKPKHVFAETITYNAVAYSYLPIDSTVVKIDTVRLPQDGRVPIFRRGDTILISNRQVDDIGSAHTGGQTIELSRQDVDRICINDTHGTPVNAQLWDYDLDAGTITWSVPLDLSNYQMPLSVAHVQEERNRILTADIDGTLTLIFPTKRAYPTENTYVSSVLIGGDLQVRVSVPFTQRNWDNVWRDEPNGSQLLNRLNLKDYPMVLTDDGAIQERWMIKFTSTNQFELYGETLGFVTRSDTLTNLAPLNPATRKPYFVIPRGAFGNDASWAAQDVIRFNTWGTLMPIWVLCAVQPSSNAPESEDGFTQCLYGDTSEI